MRLSILVLFLVVFVVVYSKPNGSHKVEEVDKEDHLLERRGKKDKAEKEKEKEKEKAEKEKEKEKEKAEKEKEKAEKEKEKEAEKLRKKLEKERKKAEKKEKWHKVEEMLANNGDLGVDDDDLEKHYPKKLKEKKKEGKKVKKSEHDTFENNYGRYKNRTGISVMENLNAINNAHDQQLDEVDMIDLRPPQSKRDAMRDQMYLWIDRVVPYVIDPALKDGTDTIVDAMNEIQSASCIQFVPYTGQSNWIKFVSSSGCWSSVGRKFWVSGYQELSLGSGCLFKGIIIHELLHSLGFYHEQSRYDRDENVEIFWENIPETNQHNFDRQKELRVSGLGTQYDAQSIMHYGKFAFAKDPSKPTIVKLSNPETSIGQRDHLSDTDKEQLNLLYSCTSTDKQGWSNWSEYGPCTKEGRRERSRFCMHPTDKTSCPNPTNTMYLHYGVDTEVQTGCAYYQDGHWGRWSSWGSCSVTCAFGTKSRTRKCDDPAPSTNGAPCKGISVQSARCEMISCDAGPYDCKFETQTTPTCKWTKDLNADFQWRRHTGSTPSSSTGPSGDHTSGTGYYMYIESSSPAMVGYKARLVSPQIKAGVHCLAFWYNMYGFSTGSLNVYLEGSQEQLFTLSGDQLKDWHLKRLNIDSAGDFKIVIEAVRGSSFQGDIAIDDIKVKDGPCFAPPTPLPTTTEETTTTEPPTTTTEPPTTTTSTTTPLPTTTTTTELTTTPEPHIPEAVPVGCYKDFGYIDSKRPFSKYKDLSSIVIWSADVEFAKNNFKDVVGNCSAYARANGYQHFAIQYYYECWTGANEEINYGRDGESVGCWPQVDQNAGPFLIGQDYSNMVYRWED
uniref:Metalloendopeptidase n=1 Tax=Clytia hemisphaerica TaxID=252671 RepID=A0A7M5V4V5_9CNID